MELVKVTLSLIKKIKLNSCKVELNRSNFDLKKCRKSIRIRQSKLSLIKNFIRQFLLGQYKLEGRLSCGYTRIGILR